MKASLTGRTVLITAGPTREYLDPVRFISNESSGRMGAELAEAAARRGAKVIVVAGPTRAAMPARAKVFPVVSALQMFRRALAQLPKADIFIAAAAVGDWRPANISARKLKKTGRPMSLRLVPNPDIVAEAARRCGAAGARRAVVVGFALETGGILAKARRKLERKNLDMIVANGSETLSSERTRMAILTRGQRSARFEEMTKKRAAALIVDRAASLWKAHACG